MENDLVYLGPAPAEEPCAQVGEDDYSRKAKAECRAYIEAIRKVVGREPEGARLSIKASSHDYGTYYEVVAYFDGDNQQAAEYAYRCEEKAPTTWAEAGMTAPGVAAGRQR